MLKVLKKVFELFKKQKKQNQDFSKVAEVLLRKTLDDAGVLIDADFKANNKTKSLIVKSNGNSVEFLFYHYLSVNFALKHRKFEKGETLRKLKNQEIKEIAQKYAFYIDSSRITSIFINKDTYHSDLLKLSKPDHYYVIERKEDLNETICDIVRYCIFNKITIKTVYAMQG